MAPCRLLPSPLPALPNTSASQDGTTDHVLGAIWNLSCPQALLRVQAGPPPCGNTTVASAEPPVVFPSTLSPFVPSSGVSALFVLILLPEGCCLQILQWLELHSGTVHDLLTGVWCAASTWQLLLGGQGPEAPLAHGLYAPLCHLSAHLPYWTLSFMEQGWCPQCLV